ncbi:MAG: hypothetical protein HUJ96_01905, partial [Marinilabiliaceae bacterium]|nr:hypothetical protein [Marinilabiliaceae bacterium]
STISFDASEASTVKGYSDLLEEIDDLKAVSASLSQSNEKLRELCEKLSDLYYIPKYGYSVVDLGLDSGTLWAKYNVGASKIEEYGSYFAWGETTGKATYTKDNSTWHGKTKTELKAQDVIDGDGNLTAKYDAATKNWGDYWRMPTLDEINELLTLKSEYKVINNVKGRLFYGKNGNTLFIPFAGNRSGSNLNSEGSYGDLWSSTPRDAESYACELVVSSGEAFMTGNNRYYGRSVRAVLKTK